MSPWDFVSLFGPLSPPLSSAQRACDGEGRGEDLTPYFLMKNCGGFTSP